MERSLKRRSQAPRKSGYSLGRDSVADARHSTPRSDATPSQGAGEIDITALENDWIAKSKKRQKESTTQLPFRPAFGSQGNNVNLLANYFVLAVEDKALWKYTLKITPTDCVPAEKDKRQAKGNHLKQLVRTALEALSCPGPMATEYKRQVVTVEKLKLPKDGVIRVSDPAGGEKERMWDVNFHTASGGPESINVDGLLRWLKDTRNPGSKSVFSAHQTEIGALNVILGHMARTGPEVPCIGSTFFDVNDKMISPTDRHIEILRGYMQSVRPATGRLLLNSQVTASRFLVSGPLYTLFEKWEVEKMNEHQLKDIDRLLSEVLVLVYVPDSDTKKAQWLPETARGLSATTSNRRGFHTPDTAQVGLERLDKASPEPILEGLTCAQSVTVAEYYKKKYNREINKEMPVIDVGKDPKVGEERVPIFIPAEYIKLPPGQSYKRLLSIASEELMRFAVQPPKVNKDFICGPGRAVLNLDNNTLLTSFGITVGNGLVRVPGRELPEPKLVYRNINGGEKQPKPQKREKGTWNLTGKKVAVPGKEVRRWTYMHSLSDRSKVRAEINALVSAMKDMGININAAPTASYYNPEFSKDTIAEVFGELGKRKPRLQLLLVVLPTDNARIYDWVKQKGDIESGVHTVCLLQNKFVRAGPDYYANVGLKVNLKFRGVNHRLESPHELISAGKTMFVGYGVTHPTSLGATSSSDAPSIAGLVASMDPGLSQWPAWTWSIPSKEEMVQNDLQSIFKACLEHWKTWERFPKSGPRLSTRNRRRALPDNIIIYRDGVSQGQFTQVLDRELREIRAACREVSWGEKPRLTIIVSVKRHSTRFYPENPDDENSNNDRAGKKKRDGNPKAGTVVDRGVTSVHYWDFFLQAHKATQGTARPAHYTVLLDEVFRNRYGDSGNPAAELEKVTHQLCYLFGRATRSVSICPPAYYADLVCTRARRLNSHLFEETQKTSTPGSESMSSLYEVHENLRGEMYYI